MYIKFLKKGEGKPSRAADYVISNRDHKKNERADVKVLRGDPKTFTAIAESLTFKLRYTSAVIAFSKSDNPTLDEISEVLDAFENYAFAGLGKHQYHMTAVMHKEDDGSKHLHILVPRVELDSKKSLNIAPPGHEKYYDPLRDYFNYSKNWSRPDDINLKHDTQQPHHEYFKAKVLERLNEKQSLVDVRKLINSYLRQRIESDLIINRDDVIEALQDIGHITRTGKDYISFRSNTESKAIRLKGTFYESNFNIKSYFEDRSRESIAESTSTADKSISAENRKLAQLEFERFTKLSEKRADYNNKYYNGVKQCKSEFNSKYRAEYSTIANITETNRSSSNIEKRSNLDAEKSTADASRSISNIEKRNIVDTEKSTADANRSISNIEKRNKTSLRATNEYQNGEQNKFISSADNTISSLLIGNQTLGDLNERITTITQSRTKNIEDSSHSTKRHIREIQRLEQRISDTKRIIAKTEHNLISNDTAPRRTAFKDRIATAIYRFYTNIRDSYESTFKRKSRKTTGEFRFSKDNRSYDFGENKAFTGGFEFENFTNQFQKHTRNRYTRINTIEKQINAARNSTSEIDRINQQSSGIIQHLLNRPLMPKSHKDCSKILDNYKVDSLSKSADEYFKLSLNDQKEIYNYLKIMNEKIIELNQSMSFLSDAAKLDCIERIIKNDKIHIDYLCKKYPKIEQNDGIFFNIKNFKHSSQKVENSLYKRRVEKNFIIVKSHENNKNINIQNIKINNEQKQSNDKDDSFIINP